MAARWPLLRANSQAAWTLGSMDPAANSEARVSRASGWARAMARWVGLPQST